MATTPITPDITTKLNEYQVPSLKYTLAELSAIKDFSVRDGVINIALQFGFPVDQIRQPIINNITDLLADSSSALTIKIVVTSKISAHAAQTTGLVVPQVKNIIAVASGKGGVGKSTTTVNLALALARAGARVGVLDADIYGPNVPQMLGTSQELIQASNKKFCPIIAHGIQSISVGHLVEENTPLIWRGPMISSVLEQLLRDTLWSELDYLFIDLPPGTGDIHLTLGQKIPVCGGIIVTTPQDVALLDARKGLEMFNRVKIAVLGVIENMSLHICSQCGNQDAIFGEHGGAKIAADCDVPLLGQLPLNKQIRIDADSGCPSVIADPQSAIAKLYQNIALNMAAQLSLCPVNYSTKFGTIVVEAK